ncbi:hypothetical protein DFH07DRAFT_774703 [Mycena maculata]|uniref:Uncharacterized protein n=1 Tax=Mycena maculata TaxID=230809 RepID=A0AAD7NA74_9AGAR|nr:hypothetical protein DFH07DRAFT_774703 [Mycena maculata]
MPALICQAVASRQQRLPTQHVGGKMHRYSYQPGGLAVSITGSPIACNFVAPSVARGLGFTIHAQMRLDWYCENTVSLTFVLPVLAFRRLISAEIGILNKLEIFSDILSQNIRKFLGSLSLMFVAAFNNKDPGRSDIATNLWRLPDDAIDASLGFPMTVDGDTINAWRAHLPVNLAVGVDSCLQVCGLSE